MCSCIVGLSLDRSVQMAPDWIIIGLREATMTEKVVPGYQSAVPAERIFRPRVLGFVLAGGKGTRLYPLTRDRAKPAVPFGGKYRIIDFVLSNFVNSDIHSIYVLTQFRSQSLLQHLSEGWQFSGMLKDYSLLTCLHKCVREVNPGISELPMPSFKT